VTDRGPLGATARYKPALDFLTALAALAIPYVALRVLIEAHFNLDVAVALAVATDPVRLVLSALLLAMPFLLAAGGFACAFYGGRKARRLSKGRFIAQLPWLAAALVLSVPANLANLSGEWSVPFVHAGLLLMAARAGWFIDAHNPRPSPHAQAQDHAKWQTVFVEQGTAQGLYRILPPVLGVVLIAMALFGTMWLPAERVVIEGKPVLVYFLGMEDDEAVLFIPDRNAVQRFPLEALSERQICRVDNYETLAESIFGAPEGLPACPE
jgi:hypothetical protein